MNYARPLVIVAAVACMTFASCRKATTPHDRENQMSEARNHIESYVKIGESRPFTASGPEFRLPDSYYQYAKEHPVIAMSILEERLKSSDANVRCNAYDFVTQLAEVPETRQKAMAILEQAAQTEGYAIQQFVRAVLERPSQQHPATTP